MSCSCPHLEHQQAYPQPAQTQNISFCSGGGGCSRTFFRCPNQGCREANRPFARHCRHCNTEISFVVEQADTKFSYSFKQSPASFSLATTSAKILSLNNYYGHLLVVAEKLIHFLDLNSLDKPLKTFQFENEIIREAKVFPAQDAHFLYVTTSKRTVRINLIQLQSEIETIYQVANQQTTIQATVFDDNEMFFLEYESLSRKSRLKDSNGSIRAEFNGLSSLPVTLNGRLTLFGAGNNVYVYNSVTQNLNVQTISDYLYQNATPSFSPKLNVCYLVGTQRLWRLKVMDDVSETSPLNADALGSPQISAYQDTLFVVRDNGFSQLNSFGETLWDTKSNFIMVQPHSLAPRVQERYVTYMTLGRTGGSEFRIHDLNSLNNFEILTFEKQLSCMPLLALGKVIAAMYSNDSIELQVFG